MATGPSVKPVIQTFVFLDLEATGLPRNEENQTKITELAMVAVNRKVLLKTPPGNIPRVLRKLVLCFTPNRIISSRVTGLTGLSNELLASENAFDKSTVVMLNIFLSSLQAPVCLVAHNGLKFDFPVLRTHIIEASSHLVKDIVCVDSYVMFRALFGDGRRPNSFGLKAIYEYLLGKAAIDAHRAENDCILLLECFAARSVALVTFWCDQNMALFNAVPPMQRGVRNIQYPG